MKHILLLGLLFYSTLPLLAAADPGAQYVDAFLLIQEGDAAKAKSDWKTAYNKFSAAQGILNDIKAADPAWNAHLIEFRLEYCAQQIEAIKPNLPATPPPLAATIVAPPKPSRPYAETAAKIKELEKQVDTLKRENKALAASTAVPEGTPGATEIAKLRAELAQANLETERAKTGHLTARAELNKNAAEQETRLAEANRKVSELQQQIGEQERLRSDLARATAEAEELRKQQQKSAAKPAARPPKVVAAPGDSGAIHELRRELGAAQSAAMRGNHAVAQLDMYERENRQLRQQLAAARKGKTEVPAATVREIASLKEQNRALAVELAALKKQPVSSAPSVARSEPAPVDAEWQTNRLREENALLRQLLNRYATRSPELKRVAEGLPITVSPRKQ